MYKCSIKLVFEIAKDEITSGRKQTNCVLVLENNLSKNSSEKKVPSLEIIKDLVTKYKQIGLEGTDKKLHMDIKGFFKYYCNFCFLKKNDLENNMLFNLGKKFLTMKLDLIFYLRMMDQINHLKTLLLKPYQIFLLDNRKKVNLHSETDKLELQVVNEEFSSENDAHINIIQHLVEKKIDNTLEPIDKVLMENIGTDLHNLIETLGR
jgi:hypothetical protein